MKKDDLNVWLVPAKKFQSMESQFDVVVEDLFNASIKLEEKEKVCKWELKGLSHKMYWAFDDRYGYFRPK
jgi:ABC-type Zn2+ transport system substrate-binding protein/surface adhesin